MHEDEFLVALDEIARLRRDGCAIQADAKLFALAQRQEALRGVRTAWGGVPVDHPPPTVATSEGPKPRKIVIDITAEGRPEPADDFLVEKRPDEGQWFPARLITRLDQHERDIKALSNAVVELRNLFRSIHGVMNRPFSKLPDRTDPC